MTPEDRPNKDGLNHLPQHLNPNNVPVKSSRWEIWVIVLVTAAISILLTAGILQALDQSSPPAPSKVQDEIRLVGISQQLAVIVTSAEERREIKLLDTQSLRVQDVTRGQTTALTTALSPNGKYLAFVSDSPDGPTVSVVEVKGGKPLSLATSTVLKAGEDVKFDHPTVCKWTNVSWSTDSSRFLIFGCDKGESAVIIVSVGQTLDPLVLADTRAKQKDSREAIWINDHEILFSQESDATSKIVLKKTSANDQSPSVLIYGE